MSRKGHGLKAMNLRSPPSALVSISNNNVEPTLDVIMQRDLEKSLADLISVRIYV